MKAKSQLLEAQLREGDSFAISPLQTHYSHHCLPTRNFAKLRPNRDFLKTNSAGISSNGDFAITSNSRFLKTAPNKPKEYGRNIFPKPTTTLGPGSYEANLGMRGRVCYIEAQKAFNEKSEKFRKSKLRNLIIESRVGPGSYDFSEGMNKLSVHRSASLGKILAGSERRLTYGFSQSLPGPADYDPKGYVPKQPSYTISTTLRSSLLNISEVNGPGSYEWADRAKRKEEEAKRGRVEYKFVYGHLN